MAAKKKPQNNLGKVIRHGVATAGRAVRDKAVDLAVDAEMLIKHPKDTLIEWGGQFLDDYNAPRGRMAPPRPPAAKPTKPAPRKKPSR
jgi:hypothetical protein